MHNTSIGSMLLNKRYLPIFITHTLSSVNINFIRGALVFLIVHTFKQEPEFWTMVTTTAMSIPFFLFSVMAGQLTDKFSKSLVTQQLKLLEIFTSAFMVFALAYVSNPWILVLASLVASTQQAFLSPVKLSILPENFKRDELMPANALLETSTIMTIIVGFGLGWLIPPNTSFSIFGYHTNNVFIWYFGIMTMTLSIIGYIASLYITKLKPANPKNSISFSLFSTIQKNIDDTIQHDHIWKIILGISWIWFIGSIIQPTIYFYVSNELNAQNDIYVLLSVLFTIGVAVGSIFCSTFLKKSSDSRYSPTALFLISIASIILFNASYPFPNQTGVLGFLTSTHGLIIVINIFIISFLPRHCGCSFIRHASASHKAF